MAKKRRIFRSLLFLFFLPFFLLNSVLKPIEFFRKLKYGGLRGLVSKESFHFRNIISKLLLTIISLTIITTMIPMWLAAYFAIVYIPLVAFGVVPTQVKVNGHSMLPTLKDNELESFYFYTGLLSAIRQPGRGDIVTFRSGNTTDEKKNITTFVKRVVAIPNDEVEIKDGFFYLNGQLLEEPYILKPRSTFGKNFIEECKRTKIPAGFVLALGDNRNRSQDSRTIGFVSIKDINGIIPYAKQKNFESRWRNASHDKDNAGLMSFDPFSYYGLFNSIRAKNGLTSLKPNKNLEQAAIKRAKWIIETNETKLNPNESKYSPQRAQLDSNYSNILSGEISTSGYFDSEDLSNYWMEYNTKEYVLKKDYQDTGIGAVVGKINGCETQVIVQEFGGYIPPNYPQETVQSWRKAVDSLNSVIPSWEKATGWGNMNQSDLKRLLDLLYRERTIAINILAKMDSNQWLTQAENDSINEYESLMSQSASLANKLNGK